MDRYLKYFNTVKYMKLKQIYYRLFYTLRSKYRGYTNFKYQDIKAPMSNRLSFTKSIDSYHSLYGDREFCFLNLRYKFDKDIDWNFIEYGKLWAYNLNYFDFLNQKEVNRDISLHIIDEFIDNIDKNSEGMEPFPISLRGINWIKFLSIYDIKDEKIDNSLYNQYMVLMDNLEYHLLGNHLLENGFSLLFGAYYFGDKALYSKAKEILKEELEEQILDDGAHFELTPMYHQIMLFRVLDSLNLVTNNTIFKDELESFLIKKATKMLSWLNSISYKDGSIPHFNDSVDGVAPSSNELFQYAKSLNLDIGRVKLQDSGYRVVDKDRYELRIDVGSIGPSYIPGHAHSDTFNFELRVDGKPFIVDTSISTYENSEERVKQRATSSHNTVKIAELDQSEVWSSFRVANRAEVLFLKERDGEIVASHDGYKKRLGILHQRRFKYSDSTILIKDNIIGQIESNISQVAYLHFHPTIKEIKIDNLDSIVKFENLDIYFSGLESLELDSYQFATAFNRVERAEVLKVTFRNELLTKISFY